MVGYKKLCEYNFVNMAMNNTNATLFTPFTLVVSQVVSEKKKKERKNLIKTHLQKRKKLKVISQSRCSKHSLTNPNTVGYFVSDIHTRFRS